VPASDERQRPGLRLKSVCQGLQHPGAMAHPHQALHPQNQREGREVRPPADCVYIQTLCKEWAYAMAFPNSEERNGWLPSTCRSITGSGSNQPWAGFHLSSSWLSCSAGEPGEAQHLDADSCAGDCIPTVASPY